MDREEVIRKDLRKNGASWEGVKRKALNRLEWKRSACSHFGLRPLGAAMSLIPLARAIARVMLE